jgi:serine/threonine protein kinase
MNDADFKNLYSDRPEFLFECNQKFSRTIAEEKISSSFLDLILQMLKPNTAHRITMKDIFLHKWVTSSLMPDKDEVIEEMTDRTLKLSL